MGYNFRLSDINCALGLVQLSRIEEILAARERVAGMYLRRLADEPRLSMQHVLPDCDISWFIFVVRLDDRYTQADRDRMLSQFRQKGIGCNNYFVPIHLQPFYREQFGYREGSFPVCEALAARTIALPFHARLTEADIDTVVGELKRML